jgi:hypothetical protein
VEDYVFHLDPSGNFRIGHLSAGEFVMSTRSGARIGSWSLVEGEELQVGDVQVPASSTSTGD